MTTPRIRVLLDVLHDLVDHEDSPCVLDHHGDCQEHPGSGIDGECTTARARRLLDEIENDAAGEVSIPEGQRQLTVADLRAALDLMGNDLPVVIQPGAFGDPGAAPLTVVHSLASDIVPPEWGGTDPTCEATTGVVFLVGAPVAVPVPPPPAAPVPSFADRFTSACAALAESEPMSTAAAYMELWKVWDDYAAASDYPEIRNVAVEDPATWNPASPLPHLLRMAAAGDLTPLADALWAARTRPEAP